MKLVNRAAVKWIDDRSRNHQARNATSRGLRLPAARLRDARGCAVRSGGIPRTGGLPGLLGVLVWPVPSVVSLDADHENHLRRQRAYRYRRQCGYRPGPGGQIPESVPSNLRRAFRPQGVYRRVVQGARHALECADRPPRRGALYARGISTGRRPGRNRSDAMVQMPRANRTESGGATRRGLGIASTRP